jgi:glycosyltransferase involved in cell wall biosynthesis
MPGYTWVSTPSDAAARELEKLGHKIVLCDSTHHIPFGDFDFVWSPYESVTLIGDAVAKKLDIPHVSHIEVLPPWRVQRDCDVENYGLQRDDPELKVLDQTIPYYLRVGKVWKNVAIKTISTPVRVAFHEKLLGPMPDLQIRYPSIDVESLDKAKIMYSPKRIQNQILTVARVTFIKRYDLLVNVMNHVKSKVTWTIIGDGPALKYVKENLSNENVTLDCLGALWGWAKMYEMMRSKLFIYAMGAMPCLEAAYLGAFPLAIEAPATRDIPDFDKFLESNFGGALPIFKYNEHEKMATAIDEELSKSDGESLKVWDTANKFLSGKTNVTPASVNAKQIIERFKVYLKNV